MGKRSYGRYNKFDVVYADFGKNPSGIQEESDLVSLFPVMQVTTTELHRYRLFH